MVHATGIDTLDACWLVGCPANISAFHHKGIMWLVVNLWLYAYHSKTKTSEPWVEFLHLLIWEGHFGSMIFVQWLYERHWCTKLPLKIIPFWCDHKWLGHNRFCNNPVLAPCGYGPHYWLLTTVKNEHWKLPWTNKVPTWDIFGQKCLPAVLDLCESQMLISRKVGQFFLMLPHDNM